MLFLLDANVLIDAARDYYPLDVVPEFWDWLIYQGSINRVKIPVEIYEEVCSGSDDLARWLKGPEAKGALLFDEERTPAEVNQIVANGYAADLTDSEVDRIGCDPFLISHCFADRAERCVVTTEVSKPSKTRANRHVPDVCGTFGLRYCNTFVMIRELGFRTSWR
ncbi:MAG: DUF4411 family protein [Gemmatimonas sp.]|jgi:hypothetical protein|uniref:DUF4411 family protein n=1 Tax=Gemmatimonas sp. TaxID=1962908 RepID=UPI00391F330E